MALSYIKKWNPWNACKTLHYQMLAEAVDALDETKATAFYYRGLTYVTQKEEEHAA